MLHVLLLFVVSLMLITFCSVGEVLDGNEIDNGTQGVHIMTPITHHHTDPEQTLVINASDLPVIHAKSGHFSEVWADIALDMCCPIS